MLSFKRGRSIAWVLVLGGAAVALLRTTTSAQGPGGGGPIRTDISGDWVPAINEDQPHRASRFRP